jgi:hypothetical protein
MYKKSLKIPKEVTRRCKMKERKHTVQKKERGVLEVMVFNATFNNISVMKGEKK